MSKRNTDKLKRILEKYVPKKYPTICVVNPTCGQLKTIRKHFPKSTILLSAAESGKGWKKTAKKLTAYAVKHPKITATVSNYLPAGKFDLVIYCTVGKSYRGSIRSLKAWLNDGAKELKGKKYIVYYDRKHKYLPITR
ncbi:MAG: hypothetical protein NC489_08265 [Ruminococcus flavefaciens]|nr:hypothetical protein [Ruminococcus flavefaciens]